MAKEEVKRAEGITIIPPDPDKVAYESVLNINYYKKGSPFFGSIKDLRYRLIREDVSEAEKSGAFDTGLSGQSGSEETGAEKGHEEHVFRLSVWEGPFSYEAVEQDKIRDFFFSFDEEGRRAAVDKINHIYEEMEMK